MTPPPGIELESFAVVEPESGEITRLTFHWEIEDAVVFAGVGMHDIFRADRGPGYGGILQEGQ
jgi:hypothetical protein